MENHKIIREHAKKENMWITPALTPGSKGILKNAERTSDYEGR
jgi:hypothetical protein